MVDKGYKGFGVRRKRNISFSGLGTAPAENNRETSLGISWPTPLGETEYNPAVGKYRFGHPLVVNSEQKECPVKTSEKKYPKHREPQKSYVQLSEDIPATQKVTIYLPADLVVEMKKLKKARRFPSVSWLIQEAVSHYLASRQWVKGEKCE